MKKLVVMLAVLFFASHAHAQLIKEGEIAGTPKKGDTQQTKPKPQEQTKPKPQEQTKPKPQEQTKPKPQEQAKPKPSNSSGTSNNDNKAKDKAKDQVTSSEKLQDQFSQLGALVESASKLTGQTYPHEGKDYPATEKGYASMKKDCDAWISSLDFSAVDSAYAGLIENIQKGEALSDEDQLLVDAYEVKGEEVSQDPRVVVFSDAYIDYAIQNGREVGRIYKYRTNKFWDNGMKNIKPHWFDQSHQILPRMQFEGEKLWFYRPAGNKDEGIIEGAFYIDFVQAKWASLLEEALKEKGGSITFLIPSRAINNSSVVKMDRVIVMVSASKATYYLPSFVAELDRESGDGSYQADGMLIGENGSLDAQFRRFVDESVDLFATETFDSFKGLSDQPENIQAYLHKYPASYDLFNHTVDDFILVNKITPTVGSIKARVTDSKYADILWNDFMHHRFLGDYKRPSQF